MVCSPSSQTRSVTSSLTAASRNGCWSSSFYSAGRFAAGAAYTEVKYQHLNDGHDGIRNAGAGVRYSLGPAMASALYTYTENTQTKARIHVGQLGANWSMAPAWTLGGNVQYMKGNAVLQGNNAIQVTSTLMYRFSKRTAVYAEGVYQRASGDGPATGAWINGLSGPDAASSGRTQVLGTHRGDDGVLVSCPVNSLPNQNRPVGRQARREEAP